MNWGEFKKVLETKGVTDDEDIWYIDVTFPTEGSIDIGRDKALGLKIS